MRAGMRGSIILLALVLAAAGAGTVLCEMDCAACGHAASTSAMDEGAASVAMPHCAGELMDLSQHEMPMPHGSSGGNTKHSGVHSHPRIVATTTARIQISAQRAFSDFAVNPAALSSGEFARVEGSFWNHNSSPPIGFPPVFSANVLRI